MGDIITKILFLIVVLPVIIAKMGYQMLKNFMTKHGYTPEWLYMWLVISITVLVFLLIFGYR